MFGDFQDDLNSSNYQVKLDESSCEILSVKADEIECLIPPWNKNSDGEKSKLQVKHTSEVTQSVGSEFSLGWPDPMMRLVPSGGAAEDIIGFHFIYHENYKNMISLKIEDSEVTFNGSVVGDSSSFIINGKIGENIHGDQSLNHKVAEKIRGLHWTGG